MKKMVFALCAFTSTLQAMHFNDEYKMFAPPITIEDALKELVEKQEELKKSIQKIKEENTQNRSSRVPNVFGLDGQECILPKSSKCCENPLLRTRFLDAILDAEVKKLVAYNCLGLIMRQNPPSILSADLLIERYQLQPAQEDC